MLGVLPKPIAHGILAKAFCLFKVADRKRKES